MAIDIGSQVLSIKNPANKQIQDEVVVKEIDLRGFCDKFNVARQAGRVMKGNSFPLPVISFPVNRRGFKLEPNDVFRFPWLKYGLTSDRVWRVINITEEEKNSERLIVKAQEDFYSYAASTDFRVDVSEIEEPKTPVVKNKGKEGKVKDLGKKRARILITKDPLTSDRRIFVFAMPRTDDETGYIVYQKTGDGSSAKVLLADGDFCAGGELTQDYPVSGWYDKLNFLRFQSWTNLTADDVAGITEEELFGGMNLAIICKTGDDAKDVENIEIVGFQTIEGIVGSDNEWSLGYIWRGLMGTKIVPHYAKEKIFIFEPLGGKTFAEIEGQDSKYKFKIVPYSGSKELSYGDASTITVETIIDDYDKHMATELKVNGLMEGATYTQGRNIAISWKEPADKKFTYNLYVKSAYPSYMTAVAGQVVIHNQYQLSTDASNAQLKLVKDGSYLSWEYLDLMNRIDNHTRMLAANEPDELIFIVEPALDGRPYKPVSIACRKTTTGA